MPPSFPLFLGFLLYIAFMAISLVVGIPMLFIKSQNLFAKKLLLTASISFPCLIIVGLAFAAIFFFPAIAFSWLAHHDFIPRTPGIIMTIVGLLTFITTVALCSLYLWYFISRIFYKRLEGKPIQEFLNGDKVYQYLKPYLIKLKKINN